MFQFNNQTVYIISPERWGIMKVSKHHYSLELAKKGCRVYFMEPPTYSAAGIEIKSCPDDARIQIVQYRPVFRGKRFLPFWIFSFLIRKQIRLLIRAMGQQPDVVISFQGNLFHDLKWFGAQVSIFFAADLFYENRVPDEIKSADLSIAISDTIFDQIKTRSTPAFQLNHGVQEYFVSHARNLLQQHSVEPENERMTVGYTGNLRMEALDRETMKTVIRQNPDVDFIFWGSYLKQDANLGGNDNADTQAFISFLQQSKNVILRGPLDVVQLREEMKKADLFWICWKLNENPMWDGSNSHKILEYLSYGKPVVAHHVSSYLGKDLFYMLPTKSNEGYTDLFRFVLTQVKNGEPEQLIQNRLLWVIENSYTMQIHKIEHWVNQVLDDKIKP